MSPILIVGAGPVGLTLAAELARYGVAVRLIDRSPHSSETSKALVVWTRTLELMDRMGCTPAFLAAGLRAHGATIRTGTTVLGHTRFDDIPGPYPFALMLPQRDTERLLTAHLTRLGVTVERDVALTAYTLHEDRVDLQLRHVDGREEAASTAWLLGCDGAHSTVRHGMAAAFAGSTQGDDWLLADVRLDGEHTPPTDELAIWLHHDGALATFPMPGGRSRVIGTVGPADPDHRRPDPTLAQVQALMDVRTGGGIVVSDPVWLSTFRINERKATEYRRGRLFLAGDAAHVHSPAGGQGMNTGIQDAVNLAWKLAMVLRGDAAAGLLDSYSPERSAVGEMVLRDATRLTDMVTLRNPAAKAARNVALRVLLGMHVVQAHMADRLSETQIAYERSPLTSGDRAGARLAPEAYAGPPPGAGDAPRFVLFAAAGASATALAARFPRLLEPALRTPVAPGHLQIVRPDGYVGLSARADDWAAAESYLMSLAG